MSYTFGQDAPLNVFNSDQEVEALFAINADIQAMLDIELALVSAQAHTGVVPMDHARKIKVAIEQFTVDEHELATDFKNDGVAPPYLVRKIRALLEDDVRADFHRGATSQDLIDSSVMMRLRDAVAIIDGRLEVLDLALDALAARSADGPILQARTRMQNALPISASEKVGGWKAQLSNLKRTKPEYFPVQLGGPEGAARNFGQDYDTICKLVAEELNLNLPEHQWQTDRHPLLSIAFWVSTVATTMGKIAQDILIMVQTEVAEISLASGGKSSAMPHKKNPVLAEIVVAQARYCHTQMSGLHTASLHENERSGVAWTLEWMLLPPLVIMASKSVLNAGELIENAQFRAS